MKVRLTDADIHAAICHADHAAWTRIVEALSPVLYSLLRDRYGIRDRFGYADAVVDDIVQDTWLRAFTRRDQFGHDGNVTVPALINWLCSIAIHRFLDGDRRRRRIVMTTSVDVSEATWAILWDRADDELGPEPLLDLAERHADARHLLALALAGMSPFLAATVPFLVVDRPGQQNQGIRTGAALRRYHRRDQGGSAEMAAALGIGRCAAKSRAYRARLAGRQAVCRALGLPPSATLAEALAALDELQERAS